MADMKTRLSVEIFLIKSNSFHIVPPFRSPFFLLLTPPRFGPLNREIESSGSQPVYQKLFPNGPRSSNNNFFEMKIFQRHDWETPSLSCYDILLPRNVHAEM